MGEEVQKYQEKEKVAEREKELQVKRDDIQDQITSLIPLAGTIILTPEQEKELYGPINEEDVEIRPDGLIYLPWMFYVTRLRKAFGMSWTLIPYGPPRKLGNFIHAPFWLIIQGKPYGFAVGEQQYFENDRMTYGDALEGAKSNALMRLCKGLGISLELWQPDFRRKWIPKYAESFGATWPDGKPKLDKNGKQKIEWRKTGALAGQLPEPGVEDAEPSPEPQREQGEKEKGKTEFPSPLQPGLGQELASQPQAKLIYAMLKKKGIPDDEFKFVFKESPFKLEKRLVNEALQWIEKYNPAT